MQLRKPLKNGFLSYIMIICKLVPDPRLNADGPLREKKVSLSLLQFGSSLTVWNSFADISFWTWSLLSINYCGCRFWLLPCFPAPPGSLCQDMDFDYLLSLPVATHKLLFPKLGSGFQDTNPSWRSNRKRLVHTVPQVASRWQCHTIFHLFHLFNQGVWMLGSRNKCLIERGLITHKKRSYISLVGLYKKISKPGIHNLVTILEEASFPFHLSYFSYSKRNLYVWA